MGNKSSVSWKCLYCDGKFTSFEKQCKHCSKKSTKDKDMVAKDSLQSISVGKELVPGDYWSNRAKSSRNFGDSESYNMTRSPKGYALIFNIVNFDPPRDGSDVDAGGLKNYFESEDFIVINEVDLKGSDIYGTMRTISDRDHSSYDAFVCCILSHGSNHNVAGIDGLMIRIATLMNFVVGSNCPTLAGKPKLFFIQACQGENEHQCIPVAEKDDCSDLIKAPLVEKDDCSDLIKKIPCESDMLLAISTTSGHVSYRHKEHGSFFIQALVNHLSRNIDDDRSHLLDILLKVNKDVAEMVGQQPAVGHTLRKKVYL